MLREFFLKHKNKFNISAKIIVLALPFLVLVYFGIKIYDAKKYQDTYALDFNKNNFNNKNLPFYVSEDANSPKVISTEEISNNTVAAIAGSPLSFVFQPKEFPLNKTITFSAQLKDFGDWEISLVCPNCDKKDQNIWQPFYYGFLSNGYEKVATYTEAFVYSSDIDRSWEKADNLDDWLAKNVTKNDTVAILNKAIAQSRLADKNLDFKDNSFTILDKSIRGPHQFYVYLKNNLDLNIVKKDLNIYDNADDVRVAIYDSDNNLIGQGILPDDGITKKSDEFSPVVRKNFNFPVPREGVYRLSLEEVGGNTTKDWLITYLKVNTNKIMFVGQAPILFVEPIDLYVNIKHQTELETNIWMKAQVQATKFYSKNYNFQISSSEEDVNKWKKIVLEPEDYQISYAGNQYLRGPNVSWKKEALFSFAGDQGASPSDANIVITHYSFIKTADDFISVEKKFSSEEIDRSNDLSKITIQIRNNNLNKQFKEEDALYQKGYNLLAQFNQYNLFGTKELNDNREGVNLVSWLNNVISASSTLRLPSDLTLTGDELKKISSFGRSIITDTISSADFQLTESVNPGQVIFKEVKINVK
jgi:hypothetical protein